MSFWNNPENNSLKVLLLVILAGIAGYFISGAVHRNSLSSTGSVGILTTGSGSSASASAMRTSGACTGGPTLALNADPALTATTVTHGDVGDVIGQFLIHNDTPCKYTVTGIKFVFLPSIPSAPMVSTLSLTADGVAFGATLAHPATDGSLTFVSTTGGIHFPPYSTQTLVVKSNILPAAPVGQTFKVQLDALRGTNDTLHTLYSWSTLTGMIGALYSNTFTIL